MEGREISHTDLEALAVCKGCGAKPNEKHGEDCHYRTDTESIADELARDRDKNKKKREQLIREHTAPDEILEPRADKSTDTPPASVEEQGLPEECKYCQRWYPQFELLTATEGACRANPPGIGEGGKAAFPKTEAGMSCGSFKPDWDKIRKIQESGDG